MRAIHIDELRKEREKEFAFIDDKDTEPFDKLLALRELQKELYKKEGYTGKLAELNLTDEPNSFAVDGKNRETKKIFISLNDLNNGKASALLYAHENAHLVDYDKGEEIAKYAETKIGENNPKNKFTEKEKAEYREKLRETVKIDKSLEQQFAEARSIDKNDRENYDLIKITSEIGAGPGAGKIDIGFIYNKDSKTGKEEFGYIRGGQVYLGATMLDYGISINTHSEPGLPIREFQGFYGSVKAKAAFYIRGEFEMDITKNKTNFKGNTGFGTPSIGFLAGIGYNEVIPFKNLSEKNKEIIRNLIKNKENVENSYNTYQELRNLRKITEEINGTNINLRTGSE